MIDGHRLRIVLGLALTRLRIYVREPGTLFWAVVFPVLLTLALGIAFRSRGAEPVQVAVLDVLVRSAPTSPGFDGARPADLLRALGGDHEIVVTGASESEASSGLRSGHFGVVVVPGSPIVFRSDPARPEGRLAAALAEKAIVRAASAGWSDKGGADRIDPLPTKSEAVTAPGSRYVDFLVPGLLGMTLMSTSLWGIGYVLVDMRSKKLLKRLVATPLRRSELLASFLLLRAFILLAEVPPLLIAGYALFGIRVYGSLPALLVLSTLGAASFACVALLLAARTASSQVVSGLINVVQMPMLLVSGVFFATEKFPPSFQPFLRLLPLTAMNDGFRKITIEGASFGALVPEMAVLGVWGVVAFVLAIRFFRYE